MGDSLLDKARKKVLVVGIAGVTNGGKTTLCGSLLKALPQATCINMDNYFVHWESEKLHMVEELHHANWDEPDAIDFEKLNQDVDDWIEEKSSLPVALSKPVPSDLASLSGAAGEPAPSHIASIPLLLIEGIMIFNYRPMVPYYDKKYFLKLPKDICETRRKTRSYFPPDPEGYFDKVAWPMHLEHLRDIEDQSDIVYMEGTESKESLFYQVYMNIIEAMRCKAESEAD